MTETARHSPAVNAKQVNTRYRLQVSNVRLAQQENSQELDPQLLRATYALQIGILIRGQIAILILDIMHHSHLNYHHLMEYQHHVSNLLLV